MPIEIEEMVTHVSTVEGDVALTPQAWEQIKRMVTAIIEEREKHQNQVRAEQRITTGVSQELQEDLEN